MQYLQIVVLGFLYEFFFSEFQNEKTTSDEVTLLLYMIGNKGVEGFEQFKSTLALSRQTHMARYLEFMEVQSLMAHSKIFHTVHTYQSYIVKGTVCVQLTS